MCFNYTPKTWLYHVESHIVSDSWTGHSKRKNPVMKLTPEVLARELQAKDGVLTVKQHDHMWGGNDANWRDEPLSSNNELVFDFLTYARSPVIPILNTIRVQLQYTKDKRIGVYAHVFWKWEDCEIEIARYCTANTGGDTLEECVLDLADFQKLTDFVQKQDYMGLSQFMFSVSYRGLTQKRKYPLTLTGIEAELKTVCHNSEYRDTLCGIRTILHDAGRDS